MRGGAVLFLAWVWFSAGVVVGAPQVAQEPIRDPAIDQRIAADRAEIDRQFFAELKTLAEKCDELKMPTEAAMTRKWYIPRRYQVQYHFLPDFFARDLRDKKLPPAPLKSATDAQKSWWNRFLAIRTGQGKRLFELAKKRLDEGRLQESFALLNEVLREDTDHADARRILSYTGKAGSWAPQERMPKYSNNTRVDTTFNWAPNRHGIVDSAHFRIRTNADAAAAVAAATYLEECHDVWRIVYSGFWLDPEEFKARWKGEPPPKSASNSSSNKGKLEVILFATRDEYVSQLEPLEKNIAQSRGYFAPRRKTSFFYLDAADVSVRVNWAHEVSHQLFSAYSRNPPGLTKNANFWVIEGAAMYMESLAAREGYWTTGGFESERLQDARHRYRNLKEHATLRELLPLGQESFQGDPRIRQLYTAGAGYTHFLLDGEQGKYRDGFLRFLRQIYDEKDTADLLEKELGGEVAKIDEPYAAFLDVRDEDLKSLDNMKVSRLILGRTSVTSEGLKSLRNFSQLKKLDLTDLPLEKDNELSYLSADCDLAELSLFGAKVTSECGRRLLKMTALKDLNLSRTDVDDEICSLLSGLPKLEVLSIGGANISDGAESSIGKMATLKELDVNQTKMTPECIERLKKSRPGLTISP